MSARSSTLTTAAFLVLMPLVAACASGTTATRMDGIVAGDPQTTVVDLDTTVASACHLMVTRTYFPYASSTVTDGDKAIIGDVATCMKSGALEKRAILITGYTDSDGSKADNRTLGMSRGQAVASELMMHGVASDRLYVRSMGERRARSESDDVKMFDRKVELRVID